MQLFCIFLSLVAVVHGTHQAKVYRDKQGHWFGPNMTVPTGFANIGSVDVQGFGIVNVISNSPDNVYMVDNGFTLHGGGRAYLATGWDIGDPYTYWTVNLVNKHFAYSIDVSNVGCKCNAAMYWVNMPGYEGTDPFPGPGGDYYCDANFVNDNWCPEYDTYEGNAETTNVALHRCEYIPPVEFPSCDRGGCGTNACSGIPHQYCRGCTIDTNNWHYISHSQIFDGDHMVVSNHFYEQNGKSATFDACLDDQSYVADMGYSLSGIVPVFSLWDMGCDESWLDGCTGCGGCCDLGGSSVTFTNFQLESVKFAPNPYVRELYAKYNSEE